MLEHMNYLPSHVLGMHAVGDVTINDYQKALLPLLQEQVKKTGKINFLLVLETNIQNFTAGAWCGNVQMGLKFFMRWNRLAIVTDQKGVKEFSHLFKYIIPGQYKGYSLEQLDEAVKWVTGK
jgi:hypothetical protein